MTRDALLKRLEKGLRLLSGIGLALLLFQSVGVLMYLVGVWPDMRATMTTTVAAVGGVAVTAGLVRSALWVRIYWTGAKVLSTLRTEGESNKLADVLVPALTALSRLLVGSCILDVLLLPAIFLMDVFFPFKLSSVQLGMVQLASVVVPQAFGAAALILAWLARQYGGIVQERCQMKTDLDLTI
ncbi:MAG TPA: hypothetical protein PLI95_01080 [Polyangiaceae bacterium]|nr:hypothetical protein [Polyangiaceae bacterium]